MPDAKEVLEWIASEDKALSKRGEKIIGKLLKLEGRSIEVFHSSNGMIGLSYMGAEIKDGSFLVGVYGRGTTVEEAAENYYNKISGKKLVFNAGTEQREEVIVL